MVYQQSKEKIAGMSSDQPVKKKLRIEDPGVEVANEDAIADLFASETPPNETTELLNRANTSTDSCMVSIDAVDCSSELRHNLSTRIEDLTTTQCSESTVVESNGVGNPDDRLYEDLRIIQNNLVEHCLCRIEDAIFLRHLDCKWRLKRWPVQKTLRFLSTIQLLFDVYLKQNATGTICSKIMLACDTLVRNGHDWLNEIVDLSDHKSKYVTFVGSRVLSSFLIVAKDSVDEGWLQQIVENVYLFDVINRITVQKINYSLDIIKRIVEWKDMEQHPLEDSNYINTSSTVSADNPFRMSTTTASRPTQNEHSHNAEGPSSSSCSENRGFRLQEPVLKLPADRTEPPTSEDRMETPQNPEQRLEMVMESGCMTVLLTDSESFDTSHIKCVTIKSLQHHWSALVKNMKLLLLRYLNLPNAENCILTFFALWENIISVRANLSVIDTKPFYADLQSFVDLLRSTTLPTLIYTQLLSLFNEVLCYGSTLALQDILPEEICSLAHTIVRYVKDFRLLSDVQISNSRSGLGFIGYDSPLIRNYSLEPVSSNIQLVDDSYGDDEDIDVECSRGEVDKGMLQKISLLVLKSVAVTVKEMRCDSSDSSIDSSDYNAVQDMQIVERSIRDVLKKLDAFIKNSLEFHPETPLNKVLVHLFSEQDDYLIESMVCTLDITVGIVYRNAVYPDLVPMLDPMSAFVELLKVVSHDSDVLLDYLVSNETCFLLYLLRFLKHVRRNWAQFVSACGSELDSTLAVLVRLRLQISRLVSKSLFPYNITPVLRLLELCESLYEGNELS